jgi:hypothetical protein
VRVMSWPRRLVSHGIMAAWMGFPDQRDLLNKKPAKDSTESQHWYSVWDILFDISLRPESPHMYSDQSPYFNELTEFCRLRGVAITAEELERLSEFASLSRTLSPTPWALWQSLRYPTANLQTAA